MGTGQSKETDPMRAHDLLKAGGQLFGTCIASKYLTQGKKICSVNTFHLLYGLETKLSYLSSSVEKVLL